MTYKLPEEVMEEINREVNEISNLYHSKTMFKNDANPLRYSAPKANGLYLIGNTIFNPITREEFYLVKVGTSSNLKTRMGSYRTDNPLVFHIDFYTDTILREHTCHCILCKNCKETLERTYEWYRVEREIYLEICEKGFQYFLERI